MRIGRLGDVGLDGVRRLRLGQGRQQDETADDEDEDDNQNGNARHGFRFDPFGCGAFADAATRCIALSSE